MSKSSLQIFETVDFPQSRITDHRIEFSVHNLDGFLDGEMEIMISTLLVLIGVEARLRCIVHRLQTQEL